MAKRRKVIHVASGRIFNTAAEAERAFNLPNSVLSEAIRLGRPCHGEIFQFCTDEDLNTPLPESVTTSYPDDGSVLTVPSNRSKSFDKDAKTVYGASTTDKKAAVEYFQSLGYNVKDSGGIVQFYGYDVSEIKKIVDESGYQASWGCMIGEDKNDEEAQE